MLGTVPRAPRVEVDDALRPNRSSVHRWGHRAKWQAVHGNTGVELFVDYLNASPSFRFVEHPISQPLKGATVAVQGSSHSAMIALPNLLASPVANFISVGTYRRRIND